ncbi:hypothetical protein JCGZ_24690 [Jatropha curcas]|uniref:MORF/ORRM1/DAG-like MORF domain-containing protein n=1 Tax=Jatropha curcas TaxID=180498 RepID=A0A067KWW6_JATCU|nr:multiple organellar RNA editing factor 7, mitochondrial isoform X1 [Jatropha curcas]XP_020533927.1 multiple organellar RNA editing factor 7, mitochondrial isoform X1 [Jatropha curcas]XP_020533928.2 multiple organellar RNA editing factor 7, mitochondrial isoform X2 [Jatropha curcas]XP_037497491.1 multiple organellar RNA editing factor 7, mitochondrial isoform X1 [Jatropha curcas]KDP40691.1 hypothetical protein JCGZ_24690 [Jatropha curcas]
MLHSIIRKPNTLTTVLCRRFCPSSSAFSIFFSSSRLFFSTDSVANNSPVTPRTELTRLPSILEDCDYKHWLVVMEAPKEYPLRDEIINRYVKTLAMALGSEEKAKESIYSVSTKYYYAFGCNVSENLTYKIKSLPDVKWVLPDSYLCCGESSYGGEPFFDGEVVPYDDKYHEDWVRNQINEKHATMGHVKKARRKQKKSSSN